MGESSDFGLERLFRHLDLNDFPGEECFPRCEYCVRFEGTSAFNMSNPNFWGSYFRSTALGGNADRLAKLSGSKYYTNSVLNIPKSPPSKSGSFCSPWQNSCYKEIFVSSQSCGQSQYFSNKGEHPCLYNWLLKYKNSMAEKICEKYNFNLTNDLNPVIDVYHCNEYPCVMVTVPEFNLQRGETGSLYRIASAYFIALCNQSAMKNNIPIEMVLRSSFGHNSPSVTETSTSFRINVGIVPSEYCQVVADSLVLLNNLFLGPLVKKELKLNMHPEKIDKHNEEIQGYNNIKNKKTEEFNVEKWTIDEPLLQVLCKVGDSGKRKVSLQITRMNKYVDLLAHYVSDELQLQQALVSDFSKPLSKLLGNLEYKVILSRESESALASIQIPDDVYKRKLELFIDRKVSNSVASDNEFWEIISAIAKSIDSLDYLLENIEQKTLNSLYKNLELSNLNFIRNSCERGVEDGCGSDSEGEIDIKVPGQTNVRLYSKKIIVSTGIRAINFAHFLAIYRIKQLKMNPVVDVSSMYYETSKAVSFVTDVFKTFLYENIDTNGTATIKYIDLNHCAASGSCSVNWEEFNLSPSDIVILDYSSAQSQTIKKAVNLFSSQVAIIMLINSGLKNEQVGADMNPYGTVRIVTKNLALLNELYFFANMSMGSEVLPKTLHRIRKAYKHIGATVTNKIIYKDSFRCTNQNSCDFKDLKWSLSNDEFKHILEFVNNETYKRKICIPLFKVKLHGVLYTFFNENALDELKHSASHFCNLAKSYPVSDELNNMSFEDLQLLLHLLHSEKEIIDCFIGKHSQNISTFIHWDDDQLATLSSSTVQNIVDDELNISFDNILECYEINSEIVDAILTFYETCDNPSLLFQVDDFCSIFQLLNKNEKKMNYLNMYEQTSFLSYEDELWCIYNQNLKDSIPHGFSSSESE